MDQLELIDCMSSAGIDSLRGFSYQIKVFLLYLAKLQENERMEYETIDDVSIQKLNEANFDEKCGGYMSLNKDTNTYIAIQVKRTSIKADVAKGILLNWLLLQNRGDVEKYIIFTESAYQNTDNIFDINLDDFFEEIQNANRRKDALIMKVKNLFDGDKDKFFNFVTDIKQRHRFENIEKIDDEIYQAYSTVFMKGGVADSIYTLRINELHNFIVKNLFSCIEKRRPYVCTYNEFMQEAELICNRITNQKIELSYPNFIKRNPICMNELVGTREYKQLQYCGLSEPSMKINLGYRQYYQQYRLMNLENGRVDNMDNVEMTSFENFIQTKDRVQAYNIDTPRNRFEETKKCSNSYALTEQIRYGALIYLTGERVDEDIKISWKDEENEADEH